MKKRCLQCETTYYGRTDKLFCSIACKNQYHNLLKKEDIAFKIDQSLHQNRTLLRKLLADAEGHSTWDKPVLLRLGFNFDVFTGLFQEADGTVGYRIYDFTWTENDHGQIIIRRVEEPILV